MPDATRPPPPTMQEHFGICRTYYDGCNCDDVSWEFVAELTAEATDLRGRLDRTLDYLREVATAADTEIVAKVALAAIKSLDTPAVKDHSDG